VKRPYSKRGVGGAYGLKRMVDKDLLQQSETYFEAGDHEHLVKMSGANFQALHVDSEAVDVARHV